MYLFIDSKYVSDCQYICHKNRVYQRTMNRCIGVYIYLCIYLKTQKYVCILSIVRSCVFLLIFCWSVVSSAYCTLKIIINIRLLNYPDGGMLNADSNADFVKLYQTSLPTRLHLTSMNMYGTHKVRYSRQIIFCFNVYSSSISIDALYKNKEREDSFYEILYWEYTVVGDFVLQNLYGTHE